LLTSLVSELIIRLVKRVSIVFFYIYFYQQPGVVRFIQ
jgi:hypothetical protein